MVRCMRSVSIFSDGSIRIGDRPRFPTAEEAALQSTTPFESVCPSLKPPAGESPRGGGMSQESCQKGIQRAETGLASPVPACRIAPERMMKEPSFNAGERNASKSSPLRRARAHWEELASRFAALAYHCRASAAFLGTPRPPSYNLPNCLMAVASPRSALFLYQRI